MERRAMTFSEFAWLCKHRVEQADVNVSTCTWHDPEYVLCESDMCPGPWREADVVEKEATE